MSRIKFLHFLEIGTCFLEKRLAGILEREAALSQGHQIAMEVMRQNRLQNESYEQIVAYFVALLRGSGIE